MYISRIGNNKIVDSTAQGKNVEIGVKNDVSIMGF